MVCFELFPVGYSRKTTGCNREIICRRLEGYCFKNNSNQFKIACFEAIDRLFYKLIVD